jgi:Ca-activated chloride channel family protein
MYSDNSGKKTMLGIGVVIAVLWAVIIAAIVIIGNIGDSKEKPVEERLDTLFDKINVRRADLVKGYIDIDDVNLREILPSISKYPLQVESFAPLTVEIFSSTEKATVSSDTRADNDRWLVDMAQAWNKDNPDRGISVRGIASGLMMDYIISETYVPEAMSPSNTLWGDMLEAAGINIRLVENSLTGNVAGICLNKAKHQYMVDNYGDISVENIVKATVNGEIAIGYTNPLASSTGANFLMTTLFSIDPGDVLSDTASNGFREFSANVPFVAFTTLQMRESAKSGRLDGFVFEYQQYQNSPELIQDYVFVPYGVRHDNPVFELGNLSAEKSALLKDFIAFCKSPESQAAASKYGFNGLPDYKSDPRVSGFSLAQAQRLWKDNKNADRDLFVVFVADLSGSMSGEPLARLKESMRQGVKYIRDDASVGLVSFNDYATIDLPIGKMDNLQRQYFAGAVNNWEAGGSTAMFDGVVAGLQMLAQAREQNPSAKCMLFVLTDGETNKVLSFGSVSGVLKDAGVPIYTIGFNANISVLSEIAALNEAASLNADSEDVVYRLSQLFNAEM